ncbi:hypothetical protein ACFYO2_43575 [Streptomyces sp. NPDC006602]|uniref:hypothetical protein n=1 Tax=Streptomyces sp. NPDC006602 TaxID=3364751 RepID=UPI00369FEEA0
MTTPRTRVDRVRASAGIARLALQQIEDELADDVTDQELAQLLRELHREDAPQEGVLAGIAQLLTCSPRPPNALMRTATATPPARCTTRLPDHRPRPCPPLLGHPRPGSRRRTRMTSSPPVTAFAETAALYAVLSE